MTRHRFLLGLALVAGVSLAVLLAPPPARAYVEAPHSLGQIVNLSTHIALMRVTSVDRTKNLIIYQKLRDIKGKHGQTEIRHNIGKNGIEQREWKIVMAWAEVGKEAVIFHNGTQSETCTGTYWYQAYGNHNDLNGWWGMVHGEPYLLRAFAGRPAQLVQAVEQIMAGKETIVPCMVGTNLEDLKSQRAKIQRLKASLKLDYNPKRDFVGWGGEDFRRLAGMKGFTHFSSIARVDPDAQSISCVDFNGDGKTDVVLSGSSRVALLQNTGEALGEMTLPNVTGSRSSVWADYNGDGLPDLLVATPTGPRLFTNLGKNELRDDTHLLPREAGYNVTCAAWVDQDGDGKPDVLLGNGWHGLRLYRNVGKAAVKAPIVLGDWRYIGPFPNAGRGFVTAYPPETEINYKGLYPGKGDKVTWKEGKFLDGSVNSLALFASNNDAVCYVHREIVCEKATKLPISLGSDDGLVVWLNGKKLVEANVNRACAPDQHRVTLDLKEGKNDLLLKIVQGDGDWAFYFATLEKLPTVRSWTFTDVSDEVGLGEKGIGSDAKGDSLTVCDLDGDGKADFIYGVGTGMVVKNDGKTFSIVKDTGLKYAAGKIGPVVGDYNGDGRPDLAVPHGGGMTLFRNDGGFKFTDVTKETGLASFTGRATSAAWGDVDNDGKLDLVVGVLRGPNRFFRNQGGTFEDASAAIGLTTRVFNTQAVALADINGDGVLDMVFNNEGQDSCVLLGNPEGMAKRTPVTLTLGSKVGLTGGRVSLLDKGGKLVGLHVLTGGEGRGGQAVPTGARFAVEPGTYRVEVLLSSGEKRQKEITVAGTHLKGVVE